MKNKLENKRVLVIGGAGFIGGFVVSELLKEPVREVIIYDNFRIIRGVYSFYPAAAECVISSPRTEFAYFIIFYLYIALG